MEFPKYVFKRGTGRKVNDAGLFEADGAVVNSKEDLDALTWAWCATPVEAVAATTPAPKKESALHELASELKQATKRAK